MTSVVSKSSWQKSTISSTENRPEVIEQWKRRGGMWRRVDAFKRKQTNMKTKPSLLQHITPKLKILFFIYEHKVIFSMLPHSVFVICHFSLWACSLEWHDLAVP